MSTVLIRLKDAAKRTGFHPATCFKKANDPLDDFPGLVRLGKNSIAFVEAEIEDWIAARIAERDELGYEPKAQNPRDHLPPELRNTDPRKIARKRREAEPRRKKSAPKVHGQSGGARGVSRRPITRGW